MTPSQLVVPWYRCPCDIALCEITHDFAFPSSSGCFTITRRFCSLPHHHHCYFRDTTTTCRPPFVESRLSRPRTNDKGAIHHRRATDQAGFVQLFNRKAATKRGRTLCTTEYISDVSVLPVLPVLPVRPVAKCFALLLAGNAIRPFLSFSWQNCSRILRPQSMKYGQQLEHESVPEWSLHNLDYNSLKHEIKVHTMRDQATAIAIPGHQDTALGKFENGLYLELCRQHDRVDMFITSKADEISRRLEHLASKTQRWVAKYSDANDSTLSLKRQRRFAKYERELLRCGKELQALSRFTNAQIIAFRKILKKYKKWTGSMTLTPRFNENILSNPKSFTKRTFEQLQSLQNRHDEILADLQATTPHFSEPSSSETDEQAVPDLPGRRRHRQVNFKPLSPAQLDSPVKYWNEYDDGSEAGGPEDDYAIYINPDDDTGFPGLAYVNSMLALPFEKAKQWFKMRRPSNEHRPLLSPEHGSSLGCASTVVDSEEEGYSTSDGYPQFGYATHHALPSIGEQEVQRYRDKVLVWATLGCLVFSFALLGIDSVLILTGKHKLRVEVDAGVTVGTMISLFCAGSGLGMMLYRRGPLSLSFKVMVWSAFIASCILNGMLLVLVLGNAP